jgi:membrane protein YqaA with SNARE-associated domain
VDKATVEERRLEGTLLLATLQKNRIGIKYTVITILLLIGMLSLAAIHVFAGAEHGVNTFMDKVADWGLVGMFGIALASNMTLVIQVPYNLPMFTLAIYAHSVPELLALGIATGVGGGIGEVTSYAVARTIVAHVDDLSKSSLFRMTKEAIEKRPRQIPFFVWFVSAVPIPDFTVIVPLAMIKYPWTKMIVPMITGKVAQNVALTLLFHYATSSASHFVSKDISFDLTASILVVFIMIIAYQVEKARAANNQPSVQPAQEEAAVAD